MSQLEDTDTGSSDREAIRANLSLSPIEVAEPSHSHVLSLDRLMAAFDALGLLLESKNNLHKVSEIYDELWELLGTIESLCRSGDLESISKVEHLIPGKFNEEDL